jgi:hypothetical protein
LALIGCASSQDVIIHGQRLPRLTLHYANGDTFELEHRNAFPRALDSSRPRNVDDGTIVGRVCGIDVRFDAQWFGDRLSLTGQGDVPGQTYAPGEGAMTLTLGVTELAPGSARRRIAGELRGHVFNKHWASPIVELDVSPERVVGRVGMRQFNLAADGEWLAGRIEEHGDVPQPLEAPFVIYGREVLATMAPADEGLLLVTMLACNGPRITYRDALVRGFALAPPERPRVEITRMVLAPAPDARDAGDGGAPNLNVADGNVVDGGAVDGAVVAGGKRAIDPADAADLVTALAEYKEHAAVIELPPVADDDSVAVAASLADAFRRAGASVTEARGGDRGCTSRAHDLALVAHQPATPLELAVALRLSITKLRVYVCQSAARNGDDDARLHVLVLPRPRH